jgi:hypothetical protein
VYRQHAASAAALLDPDHRIDRQPIVGMDDVKLAHAVFNAGEVMSERRAHAVDFVHEVAGEIHRAAVIVNPVNLLVLRLPRGEPREDVDVMPLPFECCRQFGDMCSHSSDGYGVERFP